jgi:hypothetical protein
MPEPLMRQCGVPTKLRVNTAKVAASTCAASSVAQLAELTTRHRCKGESLQLPIHGTPPLRELDHGKWEGRKVAELLLDQHFGYPKWLSDPGCIAIPSGRESVQAAQQRVAQARRGGKVCRGRTRLRSPPTRISRERRVILTSGSLAHSHNVKLPRNTDLRQGNTAPFRGTTGH